ncbi:diaminopimelate epimerase [Campylobacter sp.]|uniref:diaminopimelate epimerase n=1 Tax=Campylobacter sp. TaxID=205 RepID=UPI0027045715|nr:diaminopimelate epimerase [Campylobacter sp.]
MRVSKYNASGNDFVIFHTFVSKDRSELAKRLCDRFNGIGADGLIVLLPYENGVKWEFYNNDGSYAAMCGNGSRAALLYAFKNSLTQANTSLLTGAGVISGSVDGDMVEVELTKPVGLADKFSEEGREWYFYDTGVPHLVTFCENLSEFDPNLARKMRQKHNTNVNFAKVEGENLLVRTYERGVEAETNACGTGMAACFYAGVKNLILKERICVFPKSGEELGLRLEDEKIFFKGRVRHCFDANFME